MRSRINFYDESTLMNVGESQKTANPNKIGSALNKCTFCTLCCMEKEIHVFDDAENLVHVVNAKCCQMAHICIGWPCAACQTFKFDQVKDGARVESEEGSIVRKSKGCLLATFCPGLDADN